MKAWKGVIAATAIAVAGTAIAAPAGAQGLVVGGISNVAYVEPGRGRFETADLAAWLADRSHGGVGFDGPGEIIKVGGFRGRGFRGRGFRSRGFRGRGFRGREFGGRGFGFRGRGFRGRGFGFKKGFGVGQGFGFSKGFKSF